MKTLGYILSVAVFCCINSSHANASHNIPDGLLSRAVSENISYSSEFDYSKLGTTSNLITSLYKPAPAAAAADYSYNTNTSSMRTSSVGEKYVDNTVNTASTQPLSGDHIVDRVIVNKAAHQMILMKNGMEIRKFWIALSDRPQGRKQYEGDRRTPEGTYTLDYVKDHSNYYKAFHISYPNSRDIANAQRLGKRPGGMIMVHGQPPSGGKYQETVQRTNWTNGCIALLNPDLDVFLSMVDVGTPITINP